MRGITVITQTQLFCIILYRSTVVIINKFIVFCRVAATLQNTMNLWSRLYNGHMYLIGTLYNLLLLIAWSFKILWIEGSVSKTTNMTYCIMWSKYISQNRSDILFCNTKRLVWLLSWLSKKHYLWSIWHIFQIDPWFWFKFK